MLNTVWSVFFLLQYTNFCSGLLQNTDYHLPNDGNITPMTKDFSWARGNQSCSQLLEQSLQYLQVLSSPSAMFVKPALGLGLILVGCLSETDFMNMIEDEDTREKFKYLSNQRRTSAYPSDNYISRKKHKLHRDALKFNLDAFSPIPLFGNATLCSGFRQEKQGVKLNGFYLGIHCTLQEAMIQCDKLGPSCAGISSAIPTEFRPVARSGGHILPHTGSKMWLHHCFGAHVTRRSASSQCQNEQEQRIYKVITWIPVVSGWYNAGSAIYYATQGCGTQAEFRAVEASLDLGYDALLAMTGGVSAGLGVAAKPAFKAGVKAAIEYFKQDHEQISSQDNTTILESGKSVSGKVK